MSLSPPFLLSVPQPPITRGGRSFYVWHGLVPALVLALVFGVWIAQHADLWLADRVFAWEGHAWALRHTVVTERLIHLYGRKLSLLSWLALLAVWAVARTRGRLAELRRPLVYLLVATALSTVLVGVLKHTSNMDCPWDLLRYGGTRPYIGLFEARPAGLHRGECFPAGHAGAGYTWLALYFALLMVRPRLRWFGLAAGLLPGLVFGFSQQLRGAHFLSHDLAALAICWFCALAVYAIFSRKPAPHTDSPVVSTR